MSGSTPEELEFVPSHRNTTSSRRPGVDIQGTVMVRLAKLVQCPSCDGWWFGGSAVHAAHFNNFRLVDCIGRPVG